MDWFCNLLMRIVHVCHVPSAYLGHSGNSQQLSYAGWISYVNVLFGAGSTALCRVLRKETSIKLDYIID